MTDSEDEFILRPDMDVIEQMEGQVKLHEKAKRMREERDKQA